MMKNSGIEWIGNIPDTWTIVPAGGIFREIRDKNTDLKYKIPFQFKYGEIVRKSNIGNLESTTEETLQTYTCVTPNTLMINGLNLNYDFVTQRVAIVKEFGAITSAYLAVYPNERAILASFACYLLKGYDGIQVFHSMGSGVRKTFQWKDFKNLRIALPSLSIQSKIVAHLNKKCAQIDALILNQERQIEKLKQYKQSLITEVVTKGLDPTVLLKDSGVEWIGKIPEHWGIDKTIRIFNDIGSGTTPKGDQYYTNGTVNFIQSGDITGGLLYQSKNKVAQSAINENAALTLYKAPFLIIAMYGASIGHLSISMIDACVNQACCVMNQPSCNFMFAFYCLTGAKDYLIRNAIGGGQPNISQSILKALWFPIPNQKEQESIVEILDNKCKKVDSLISAKQTKIEKLNQYKKSLIYEYVTGKKEVV
ncbi:MAG: restriction endonuclease subunit S [Clostridia bacterium]|nr:restriction endonuclease subunit S [Clostridia bacterium]